MALETEKGKYTRPEGSKTFECVISFICAIMAMNIGHLYGWNSPAVLIFMAPDSPVLITSSDFSTFSALMSCGFLVVTPIVMYLVDKIGRRRVILMSPLPMILSWGLIAIATNVWTLYVARILSGVSTSMFFNVMPIYITEISSPHLRGGGLTLPLIFFNVGILIAYIIVPYMSISMSAAIFMSMNIVFLVMFYFVPESPYYLAMRAKVEETEAVLEKLRGKTDVSDEMEVVLETVKSNSQQRTGGIRELLTVRANRRAFIINNILLCNLHFCGFYTIISFVQLIFLSVTSVISNHSIAIVLGVIQVISVFISTLVIDRLGRKPLVLVASVAVAIANLVIAVFFYMKDFLYIDLSAYSWVPLIATIVLMFASTCGVSSSYLLLQAEIFSTEVKAVAFCYGGVVGALLHIISAKIYILIAVTWNYGPMPGFLLQFGTVVICAVLILRFMPETKGKTFVQIQKELND